MPLPPNIFATGQAAHGQPCPFPDGATLLFHGKADKLLKKEDLYCAFAAVYFVWGQKHEGSLVFATEMIWQIGTEKTQKRVWFTEDDYLEIHAECWAKWHLAPNSEFNVDGASQICEPDGTMRLDAIRARCN